MYVMAMTDLMLFLVLMLTFYFPVWDEPRQVSQRWSNGCTAALITALIICLTKLAATADASYTQSRTHMPPSPPPPPTHTINVLGARAHTHTRTHARTHNATHIHVRAINIFNLVFRSIMRVYYFLYIINQFPVITHVCSCHFFSPELSFCLDFFFGSPKKSGNKQRAESRRRKRDVDACRFPSKSPCQSLVEAG